MDGIGLLIGLIAIVLFLALTRIGRRIVVIGIVIVVVLAAKKVLVKTFNCPPTGAACFLPVQKVQYGTCWASEGSGLLRIHGTFYLTANAGVSASATCLSLAVWQ